MARNGDIGEKALFTMAKREIAWHIIILSEYSQLLPKL